MVDVCWREHASRRVDLPASSSAAGLPPAPSHRFTLINDAAVFITRRLCTSVFCASVFTCNNYIVRLLASNRSLHKSAAIQPAYLIPRGHYWCCATEENTVNAHTIHITYNVMSASWVGSGCREWLQWTIPISHTTHHVTGVVRLATHDCTQTWRHQLITIRPYD